jgi:K+-transporting ATPase ATPase C chain
LVAEHLVPGGILGENVINVMTLNAALDTLPSS